MITQLNVVAIKWIDTSNLLDFPENNEDISDTTDLELSMKELGFTDPIEVTDFYENNDEKYTILSGHRRRAAWDKVSSEPLPCLVRHFDNEEQLKNYVLMANAQRDSAKDPLLFCKRYKMHEEYLKSIGFKGAIAEEVANRLGLSRKQADRYKTFNRIILPVWDMVRAEEVGMSSVLKMATHPEDQQEEILQMLKQAEAENISLSREICDKIITAYRNGKRSWLEVKQGNFGSYMQAQNVQEKENNNNEDVFKRNNEVNYDYSHREDYSDLDLETSEDAYKEERLTEEDYKAIELASKQAETEETEEEVKEKKKLTEEEKMLISGENIQKNLAKLDTQLSNFYKFISNGQAEDVLYKMFELMVVLQSEVHEIADEYDLKEKLEELKDKNRKKNKSDIKCCATCKYCLSIPRNNRYGDIDYLCYIDGYFILSIYKDITKIKHYSPGGKVLDCKYKKIK